MVAIIKGLRVAGQCNTNKMKVFHLGTSDISEGEGVCFDRDYDDGSAPADAIDAWGDRGIYANVPSFTNNNAFAGVAVQDYPANASGRWIEVYTPGSVCKVKTLETSLTIGEGSYIWCLAGSSTNAGNFSADVLGLPGKGCARVMQTISAAGLVLCELMDGPESGLIEKIPTTTLTAGGAITIMVGGATFFTGAATPASDCTQTLADGTYVGQIKRYYLSGALTTHDVLVTLATTGEQLDGTTNLASLEFDGDGDNSTVQWTGSYWQLIANAGTALA